MEIANFIDTLSLYGADIALLSAATCIAFAVLKRTLLKKCPKKLMTFMPFVLGIAIYAFYAAVSNVGLDYVAHEIYYICERGFTVGSLSTAIYVWYEQLAGKGGGLTARESVVYALIAAYVPTEEAENAAKLIAEAFESDEQPEARTVEILCGYKDSGLSQSGAQAVAALIAGALERIEGGEG